MYDVIVVGARISGAATAMLLSRAGYKVLLLDRAVFPGGKAAATNLVHPPGILRLKRWGLLERLTATGCPPIREYGLQSGRAHLTAPLPAVDEVDEAYSPDRATLDRILLEAAIEAGAEFREGFSVQALCTDEAGTVTGVRGRSDDGGAPMTEHARLVVGADGSNSTVARLTGAEKYATRPVLNKSHWAYWEGLPHDGRVRTHRHAHKHTFTWPTHDGLTIVGVALPVRDFKANGDAERDRTVIDAFEAVDPEWAASLRATERAGRWMTGAVPNFLRRSHGPGWALVGDAGYTRDPITAAGITDGLRSAELLVEAVDAGLSRSGGAGLPTALARYGRRRDDLVRGHYQYTCDHATIANHSREEVEFIRAMSRSATHGRDMVGVFATIVDPAQFYSAANMHALLDHVESGPGTSWKLRMVRWLVRGAPRHFAPASRAGDRLIARNLGSMGQYLLASPPRLTAPPSL
ncbi:NAD(P)/FAD-dependent oxidoreductase [Streptomyces sp. S.PB5]|uniref:NAD(P)/FAD-dependent oxidoreductase n=1 Tax=Streptomyces sp. S.PB5 TaxID=3020844 RepID=UPI0025AFA0CF|nr:NAD(P)/FAD-dependent oxidoreductase [Streptomyces sp. S.PB5]MDN3028375.1 NAD(P)/FAD-dependent oxidoreductase [Streptomyces sp. S.PB5]